MSSPRAIAEVGAAGRAAAAELGRRAAGRVITTPLGRWLYSTDASGYRVVPQAVLVAGAAEDLALAAEVSARYGVPLTARGSASSVAGQAIGPGIVVDCFRLDRVLEIDAGARTARVQPGVIQAGLNRAASAYGLEFGPDTSTVDQATIGGMVANDSSGSRSIVYGQTIDKVERIEAVLAGGGVMSFHAGDRSLRGGLSGAGADGLAASLESVRARFGETIASSYPMTRRYTAGYALRPLLDDRPNLARVLAGSEGSLALFSEITVALDPVPQCRLGAALGFGTIHEALRASTAILPTGPSAVELLDLEPLRRSPNIGRYKGMAPLLDAAGEALLTVEYQGPPDVVREGLSRLRDVVPELNAQVWLELGDARLLAEAAALRRAVLPLLMGAPGAQRPAAFVEDTAVAPDVLADFYRDFKAAVAAEGAAASFTGHASAGCLHVRPLLDLKTAQGVGQMERIAAAVGRLVQEYHGAISGEHGCGRARSWLLPQAVGPDLYAAFVALKDALDPGRLLAPGIVIDGPPITDDLRFGADYGGSEPWRPRLSYADEGGFDLAIERCFGAGQCRKLTGTMCPPASVTHDEARSTRARANALQALVAGVVSPAQVTEEEMTEVLGTCVACKACKTECPAGVDMAALKVEWLAERRAREGVPLLARGVAGLRTLFRLAAPLAPLINAAGATSLRRPVMRLVGVAPQRPAPTLARRPLTAGAAKAGALAAAPQAGALAAPPAGALAAGVEVVLFADCFTQYQEPEIGEAFLQLMRAAGMPASVVDAGCCGRTMLSTGLLEKARRTASKTAGRLAEHARAGRTIAFVEPSCLSMVCDDWRRLLPGDGNAAAVAAASRPALAVVAEAAAAGRLHFAPTGRALLHPHCHERALFTPADTERALRMVPDLELSVLDAGCCGMSGVFGYEAEHYDLSVAIAERDLLPAVRAADPATAVLATGASCRTQIRDLSPRRAEHPLTFLAGRLAGRVPPRGPSAGAAGTDSGGPAGGEPA